jgi:lipopolysaccharide export system protein LptC
MAWLRIPPRIAAYIPILLMAFFAGLTYWVLQSALRPTSSAPARNVAHTPDYFADDISVTMLSDVGDVKYRLNAFTMQHYEDDQNTDLTQPAMRAFTPGAPVITATSKRGVVNSDGSVINLYDNAQVVREPSPTDPKMQANSEHFLVLANDDVVKTELPVKLTRGPSVSTATHGMIYTNTTRYVELFGDVRGSIAAAQFNGGASR